MCNGKPKHESRIKPVTSHCPGWHRRWKMPALALPASPPDACPGRRQLFQPGRRCLHLLTPTLSAKGKESPQPLISPSCSSFLTFFLSEQSHHWIDLQHRARFTASLLLFPWSQLGRHTWADTPGNHRLNISKQKWILLCSHFNSWHLCEAGREEKLGWHLSHTLEPPDGT